MKSLAIAFTALIALTVGANAQCATGYTQLSNVFACQQNTTGAPVVTSPSTASGTAGMAFSYQITATNSPTSYSATGLPSPLGVNTGTGLISGTPTAPFSGNVTLGATNGTGTGNETLALTIAAAGSPPVINSPTTASGTVGTGFTYHITATNMPTSYGASNLPAPLGINTSTGTISGTPTAASSSTVGLSATNGAGTGTQNLALTIAAAGSGTISFGADGGYNASASQSVVLSTPAGVANGDLMFMVVTSQTALTDPVETPNTPAGWTVVARLANALDPVYGNFTTALFSRTASSEPASYTVTMPGSGLAYAAIDGNIRNYKTSSGSIAVKAVSSKANTSNGTTCVVPAISETWQSGEWAFYVGMNDLGSPTALSPATLSHVVTAGSGIADFYRWGDYAPASAPVAQTFTAGNSGAMTCIGVTFR